MKPPEVTIIDLTRSLSNLARMAVAEFTPVVDWIVLVRSEDISATCEWRCTRVRESRSPCRSEMQSGNDRGTFLGPRCAAPPAGGLLRVPFTRAAALAERLLQTLGVREAIGRLLGQA